MTPDLETRIRLEIEALHEFFVGWFSGQLPESALERGFVQRFDDDFLLIPPAGLLLGRDELTASVGRGHATNPDFRVAIRNVTLRRRFDGLALATYEEWQRNALASTPPDNGRLASVLFRVGSDRDPLRWLHIHETWLPEATQRSGPYDF